MPDQAERMPSRIEEDNPVFRAGLIIGTASSQSDNRFDSSVVVSGSNIEVDLGLLIAARPVGRTERLASLEPHVGARWSVQLHPPVIGGRSVVDRPAEDRLIERRQTNGVRTIERDQSKSSECHGL